MAKGATVYKNISCVGPTDLCFEYEGKIHQVNVKTACHKTNKRGSWWCPPGSIHKIKYPIYPLIIVPATGANTSGWYCKWHVKDQRYGEINCPPGLENFWD